MSYPARNQDAPTTPPPRPMERLVRSWRRKSGRPQAGCSRFAGVDAAVRRARRARRMSGRGRGADRGGWSRQSLLVSTAAGRAAQSAMGLTCFLSMPVIGAMAIAAVCCGLVALGEDEEAARLSAETVHTPRRAGSATLSRDSTEVYKSDQPSGNRSRFVPPLPHPALARSPRLAL